MPTTARAIRALHDGTAVLCLIWRYLASFFSRVGVHLKIVGFDLRLRSHGSARTLRCQKGAGGSVAATHTRPQSARALPCDRRRRPVPAAVHYFEAHSSRRVRASSALMSTSSGAIRGPRWRKAAVGKSRSCRRAVSARSPSAWRAPWGARASPSSRARSTAALTSAGQPARRRGRAAGTSRGRSVAISSSCLPYPSRIPWNRAPLPCPCLRLHLTHHLCALTKIVESDPRPRSRARSGRAPLF